LDEAKSRRSEVEGQGREFSEVGETKPSEEGGWRLRLTPSFKLQRRAARTSPKTLGGENHQGKFPQWRGTRSSSSPRMRRRRRPKARGDLHEKKRHDRRWRCKEAR